MSEAAAPNIDIILDGKEVPDGHVQALTVHRDMCQADMAEIVLFNQSDIYTTQKVGGTVEIKVGGGSKPAASIYKGEIVGLEPSYKGGDKSRILIRAMNK